MYKKFQFQSTLIAAYLTIYFSAVVFAQNQTPDIPHSEEKSENITSSSNKNGTIQIKDTDWDSFNFDKDHQSGGGWGSSHQSGGGWGSSHSLSGSEIWAFYFYIVSNCFSWKGLPWEIQQIVHKCKGDRRAEKNFDCFALCVYKEAGALTPVKINSDTYYVENYEVYERIFEETYSVDRCTRGDSITTLLSCKKQLNKGQHDNRNHPSSSPPQGLYPDLDRCENLNGVFTCNYIHFFKLHSCKYQDWIHASKSKLNETEIEIVKEITKRIEK